MIYITPENLLKVGFIELKDETGINYIRGNQVMRIEKTNIVDIPPNLTIEASFFTQCILPNYTLAKLAIEIKNLVDPD